MTRKVLTTGQPAARPLIGRFTITSNFIWSPIFIHWTNRSVHRKIGIYLFDYAYTLGLHWLRDPVDRVKLTSSNLGKNLKYSFCYLTLADDYLNHTYSPNADTFQVPCSNFGDHHRHNGLDSSREGRQIGLTSKAYEIHPEIALCICRLIKT